MGCPTPGSVLLGEGEAVPRLPPSQQPCAHGDPPIDTPFPTSSRGCWTQVLGIPRASLWDWGDAAIPSIPWDPAGCFGEQLLLPKASMCVHAPASHTRSRKGWECPRIPGKVRVWMRSRSLCVWAAFGSDWSRVYDRALEWPSLKGAVTSSGRRSRLLGAHGGGPMCWSPPSPTAGAHSRCPVGIGSRGSPAAGMDLQGWGGGNTGGFVPPTSEPLNAMRLGGSCPTGELD